jgi:dihydrodipicolinate synthase/N-acetylneuraminate lyase
MAADFKSTLARGVVIPACPLALTSSRTLDERHQRALLRYYAAAGAGGVAIGVHTTQFAIREHNLLRPLLKIAADELTHHASRITLIAGVCGRTDQALAEAALARELGFDAALLTLGALRDAAHAELIAHCEAVARVIPLIGFYLQPAVGGRVLSFAFWRRFAEIANVAAIKIAPFNRYQTLDVVRAVAESGRDISLYTGNDDNIVFDLLTPFRFRVNGRVVERRIVGGLLGQWAVWTSKAVELFAECHRVIARNADTPVREPAIPPELLQRNVELLDVNAALFDVANNFAGCIPGIHYVLQRQGLLAGPWCLDPRETLSPGQKEEIDRVCHAYPHLNDDEFVRANLKQWLS